MKRISTLATAVVLALTIGLQWAVLQSVAWTSMLIERAHSGSFVGAVKTTFDGHHPCKLCRVVAAGKNAEKKSARSLKLAKVELCLSNQATPIPEPPTLAALLGFKAETAPERADVPAFRPPRV